MHTVAAGVNLATVAGVALVLWCSGAGAVAGAIQVF